MSFVADFMFQDFKIAVFDSVKPYTREHACMVEDLDLRSMLIFIGYHLKD